MRRKAHPWGAPPWTVDFRLAPHALPDYVDFAIVGGGFSGLSAAAWLRRFTPGRSVLVLESASLGDGASGRTGGMALAEAAAPAAWRWRKPRPARSPASATCSPATRKFFARSALTRG